MLSIFYLQLKSTIHVVYCVCAFDHQTLTLAQDPYPNPMQALTLHTIHIIAVIHSRMSRRRVEWLNKCPNTLKTYCMSLIVVIFILIYNRVYITQRTKMRKMLIRSDFSGRYESI